MMFSVAVAFGFELPTTLKASARAAVAPAPTMSAATTESNSFWNMEIWILNKLTNRGLIGPAAARLQLYRSY